MMLLRSWLRKDRSLSFISWILVLAILAALLETYAASACRHPPGFVTPPVKKVRRWQNARHPSTPNDHIHMSRIWMDSRLYLSRPKVDSVNEQTLLQSDTPDVDRTSGRLTERTLGILILLTVPLAWGTYTPVVKYMYDRMDPSVPGFVFSAGYYLVAAVVLSGLNWFSTRNDESGDDAIRDETNASTIGGLELGSYLFLGNGFQVVGLQTVPADRAAFLVQLTTVMVPLVSAWVSGRGLTSVPFMTWLACIIAFAGVIIMGMDDNAQSAQMLSPDHPDWNGIISSIQISQGDGLIILAALAYTMHVVRLGVYAPKTRPLTLAASKARTEAIFSVVLVMVLTFVANFGTAPEFVQQLGKEIVTYFGTIHNMLLGNDSAIATSSSVLISAILWTGMITSAYTIYAQSFGQSRINPVDSNLIYTTQPLFSSLFAYGLLGEQLGVLGWLGAAFIGVALGLVAFGNEAD
jgi:drug/metabolite transporter (DMT)-like permease